MSTDPLRGAARRSAPPTSLRGVPVVVTQPYVPAYRVPFFERLAGRLAELGSSLEVYAGAPRGDQRLRADAADGPWRRPLRVAGLRLFGRELEWRSFPGRSAPDGILVTELSALNDVAWRSVGRRPVVLWGHGRSYVGAESRASERLRLVLSRRADHVMTYTEGGRRHLLDLGLDADAVTAIGNSTDTRALTAALRAITPARSQTLARRHPGRPLALYVGGLDASKRVDFLAAAAEAARKREPGFRLLVVGSGADAGRLADGERDGSLSRIPAARGAELAELASLASAMWMPGRVGLAAVDAMALGLVVHTTEHDRHAPEIELLGPDDVAYLPDSPDAFAAESLRRMATAAIGAERPVSPHTPDIDSVVDGMVAVLLRVAERVGG